MTWTQATATALYTGQWMKKKLTEIDGRTEERKEYPATPIPISRIVTTSTSLSELKRVNN